MKILILGGTVFVGRHLVDAALERGHEVTLFNRGQHNPGLYPQVERLHGDRDPRQAGRLAALEGRHWDAVIDTCGYVPRVVEASARLLAGAVARYAFISTVSVYAEPSATDLEAGAGYPMDEDAQVNALADQTVEDITGETYGGLKVLCEQAVERALPGRALQVRPGLIVGPHDPSDRFTYWPARLARGGEVLAPGRPADRVQFVDVRDLAAWTVRAVEAGLTGPYNATGPEHPLTMDNVLSACQAVSGTESHLTWVDNDFLLAQGVEPYTELPLWIPAGPDGDPLSRVECGKAIAAGLAFRPLAATVRDTLAWDAMRSPGDERRGGLRPDREADLLRLWHERQTLAPRQA